MSKRERPVTPDCVKRLREIVGEMSPYDLAYAKFTDSHELRMLKLSMYLLDSKQAGSEKVYAFFHKTKEDVTKPTAEEIEAHKKNARLALSEYNNQRTSVANFNTATLNSQAFRDLYALHKDKHPDVTEDAFLRGFL
jgi:hypothetical protein